MSNASIGLITAPLRAPDFPCIFIVCDSFLCTGRESDSRTERCSGHPRPVCESESLPVRENESQDVNASQYATDVCLDVNQKYHQHRALLAAVADQVQAAYAGRDATCPAKPSREDGITVRPRQKGYSASTANTAQAECWRERDLAGFCPGCVQTAGSFESNVAQG